jgi:hypothetical protein
VGCAGWVSVSRGGRGEAKGLMQNPKSKIKKWWVVLGGVMGMKLRRMEELGLIMIKGEDVGWYT